MNSNEKENERLKQTKIQRQKTLKMSETLSKSLEIPVNVVTGFYNLSLVEWQKKIGMSEAETESKLSTSPESRAKQNAEILEIFSNKVKRTLKRKNKLHLLDNAIKVAQKYYEEKYASRPPDI